MVENNADILLISETKLEDSFTSGHFRICGFSMLINLIETRWVVNFYYILEMAFQLNFWNMILELILKIFLLKLFYKKESSFSMDLTIRIKTKF